MRNCKVLKKLELARGGRRKGEITLGTGLTRAGCGVCFSPCSERGRHEGRKGLRVDNSLKSEQLGETRECAIATSEGATPARE